MGAWGAPPVAEVGIRTADSNGIDSFGRWRVSFPESIFESAQNRDNDPQFWDEALETGSGIASVHSRDTSSSVFTSTANTAGKYTRQTFQRFHYQKGKAQVILLTGILQRDDSGPGVQRQLGYWDDENGLFFADVEGTMTVNRRSHVTGAPEDEVKPQHLWNVDKMDGSGPSRIRADWSKVELFFIDFSWLGTGRVRMGLEIDGQVFTVHEFRAANILDKVFMSTPDLPVRYQMITTDQSPVVTMETMCAAVMSEAGQEAIGPTRYKSTEGTHIAAAVADTVYAVFGIRLKADKLDTQVTLEAISMNNGANADFEWMVVFNPTLAGDAVSWVNQTNSSVQTAVGLATAIVTGGVQQAGGFVSGGNSAGSTREALKTTQRLGAAIDGTVDEIFLCVRPLSNAATIDGGIGWREA